jgi:inorganic pyrophosphatase
MSDKSSQDASKLPKIEVFIAVEKGSCDRHLYDETTLEHRGTRQISLPYPYPYGFIPGTQAEDGDNVDCYVITDDPLKHGRIVECVPVGLLEMEEDGEDDRKVLAALPGQEVTLDQALLETLRDFIYGVFAQFPETTVHVGRLLADQEARRYIRRHQVR